MNFWTAKSKYGATIQTALDYVMGVDPDDEDISDVFPHVAAVAAAYGDPKGKYAAFLKKQESDFASQPFWFYDQSSALSNSPASAKVKHRRAARDLLAGGAANATQALAADFGGVAQGTMGHVLDEVSSGPIPFECPAVFQEAKETELEDGLFVTCDMLKPFYEILPAAVDPGAL